MTHPIVTWTTPYQRADVAWRAAAEHLEFHRYKEARLNLESHIRYMRLLLEAVNREEAREVEIVHSQATAKLAELALLTRGVTDGAVDFGG